MIDVTCAIIRNDDLEVLIVQRGGKSDHPFKWEFPGGKIAHEESDEDCIIREISEELSMEIIIYSRLRAVEHDYGHKQIRLIPFICDTLDDLPVLSEHIAFRWISPGELPQVDFSEADIAVAAAYLNVIELSVKEPPAVANVTSDLSYDEEIRSMVDRIRSTKEADWIATSAIENSTIFRMLLEFSYSEDTKLAFHSSWILSKACDKNPEIVYPYLDGIVDKLSVIKNESAERSFLRIISLSDIEKIGEKQQGRLADHCFNRLRSGFSAIAIKAYSMEVLYKLALLFPDMTNELSASIQMIQGEGSAGIKARGWIILKKLSKLPVDLKSSPK